MSAVCRSAWAEVAREGKGVVYSVWHGYESGRTAQVWFWFIFMCSPRGLLPGFLRLSDLVRNAAWNPNAPAGLPPPSLGPIALLQVRPLSSQEKTDGCDECVRVARDQPTVSVGSHQFTFDYVFGVRTTQQDIFDVKAAWTRMHANHASS